MMADLSEYGMDETHYVKIESVEQYKLMASYLKDRGIDYFTLTERNCMEFPYAYIDGGLHGRMRDHSKNDSISFEEWVNDRGIFTPVSIGVDVSTLNSLL